MLRVSIVLFFLFLINIIKSSDFCEIQLPKFDNVLSENFELLTESGKKKFIDVVTYTAPKTFDITVSLTQKAKNDLLSIKEMFVLIDKVWSDSKDNDGQRLINVGKLLLNDSHASQTKYCTGRSYVRYLYSQPENVTFYWNTSKLPDICVRLTVILNMRDIMSRNVIEQRSQTFCNQNGKNKDEMQSDQTDSQNCKLLKRVEPTKKCNIMSSAVYRVTIENKWNSLNHWKDWPGKDGYTPKLTQYLGASHSSDFNLYHLGGMASQGVLEVCGNGSYNSLHHQFFKAGSGILTVILARSVDGDSKTNKRSALIVVNSTAHLVSFLSRLDPSPDWCTGISRFDLCDGKCEWRDKITIPLYPWDAGVYSGETYLYKKEIHNQSPICPITNEWPKDNPFTVLDGKLQSIGSVTFKIIQEFNKQADQTCQSENSILQDEGYSNEGKSKLPDLGNLKSNQEKTRHCMTTRWQEWSACSKSCGKGTRTRIRTLITQKHEKCPFVSLEDVESCNNNCNMAVPVETCSMRLWSPWSPCNATCAQAGILYRERVFINEQEKQECMVYSRMKNVNTCRLASNRCNYQSVCKEYVNVGDLCTWFSPSQRFYYDFTQDNCVSFIYKGCHGSLNNFHTFEECKSFCNSYRRNNKQYNSETSLTFANRCNVPLTWGVLCETENPSNRWSFDNINKICFKFQFNGCRGNGNNFQTQEECEKTCLRVELNLTVPLMSTTMKANCLYSVWSQWSNCDNDCKINQERFRTLIEKNGICNETLKEVRKCQSKICKVQKPKTTTMMKCKYSNWSTWSTCSSQCGQGVRERKRKKLKFNCKPDFPQYTERETCYKACEHD